MFRRLVLAALLPLALSACGADRVYAPDEAVTRARYVSGEPPSITLFTVVRKKGGEGGHAGLLIDGSQRVLYDGAGTWHHPMVPERYDLHYGITEKVKLFYIDYHARETYDVIEQKVYVSPEVAEIAIRRAAQQGPSSKAFCANAVSQILHDVPGFQNIRGTMFPNGLRRAFDDIPGVVTTVHRDGDPHDNHGVILVQKDQKI